jgi:hypothetical protein
MVRSFALILALCLAPRAGAGVVQIATQADAPPDASAVTASTPQASAHVDETVALSVAAADKVAAEEQSGWMSLLDSSSRSASSSDVRSSQNISVPSASASAPGAVIPLPPAVWSGLITLGAAGWFGMHRRVKRAVRVRRLPAFHDQ